MKQIYLSLDINLGLYLVQLFKVEVREPKVLTELILIRPIYSINIALWYVTSCCRFVTWQIRAVCGTVVNTCFIKGFCGIICKGIFKEPALTNKKLLFTINLDKCIVIDKKILFD